MKPKPWFKSYFSDNSEPSLGLCSLAARGLWSQMYTIFHKDPVGKLAIGPKTLSKEDLFRQSGISSKDLSKINDVAATSIVNREVGAEDVQVLFDSLFEELLETQLFEVDQAGQMVAPWLLKREQIRKKRAEGGKKGGNPKLRKDKQGPQPLELAFEVRNGDIPKERFRSIKSPTDSAPHPQRLRIGRILEIFESHDRPLGKSSIGAWSRRLSAYAKSRDGDLDSACNALVADLRSIAKAGKLQSSAYALKIVDGLLEHGRSGRGIDPPRGRRPDVGGHPATRRAAEELD